MRIKTFEATKMSDAMAAIKLEMGPNAVILETREKKGIGGVGLFSPPIIEVVVATDLSFSEEAILFTPARGANSPLPLVAETPPPAQGFKEYLRVLYEREEKGAVPVKKIKPILVNPQKSFGSSPEVTQLYDEVQKTGVDRETADRLFGLATKQLGGETGEILTIDLLREYIRKMIVEWIGRFTDPSPIDGPDKVIALIGPTGVGKTTTLVKIAAGLRREKKKVTLATLDTYRVGAVEQLRTYAEILGVYNRVISSTQGLIDLWEKRRPGEYIFIDTAGRSPFHQEAISQLEILTHVPVETHLVLSASTRPIDLEETIDCFKAIPIDRILFTKLDETRRHGHLFGLIRKSRIRPSYFTMGQRVPEDMANVTPDQIAKWVLP